ncbi:MAG: type II toxin-antitoxin system HicB family antitoxin [Ignavibacteriae bacterium]|nr:type II toxin-antitoxin system HicB family antitoxin [Ignavibacteriota bacterium]
MKIKRLSSHLHRTNSNFEELCRDSMSFIKSVIRRYLSKEKISCKDYFRFIQDLKNEKGIKLQGITTLNHDEILEAFFRKRLIEFADGFNFESKEGIREWNPKIFRKGKKLVYLKLHGSVNWSSIYVDKGKVENLVNVSFEDYKQEDRDGYRFRWQGKNYKEAEQLFLTGTNDKYFQYQYGVYIELWQQFDRILSKTDILICIGYGFGDNAVNLRIIDWIGKKSGRKLLVIDIGEYEKGKDNAKGAIQSRLPEWKRDRKMIWRKKNIQDLTIEELMKYIIIATHPFTITIEQENDGFISLCPELDIASQGDTIEEAKHNLQEAVELFFEYASETEKSNRINPNIT